MSWLDDDNEVHPLGHFALELCGLGLSSWRPDKNRMIKCEIFPSSMLMCMDDPIFIFFIKDEDWTVENLINEIEKVLIVMDSPLYKAMSEN